MGFGTPILLTLLTKLPFLTSFSQRLSPYLVYPSTVGNYHVRPLPWLLGNAPTFGQGLYIALFILLNIVLTCVGYEHAQPHPWGYDRRGEILAYAGYRTGSIAFALLPLLLLFSGRNNILLWLTNWSHSTFLLLHRWVARVFAVQTILHSLFLLVAYKRSGIYHANFHETYWAWGIVGTVFVCAMPIFSILWIRRKTYELFLISHIIMAIFVIVGSWYHLYYRFGLSGSYEYWLYAACAVWFTDRLMRVLRIAKNGMRRATVTEVDENHVRVDIPGLRWVARPGEHAYVYFPTVSPMKPWENHPFSVNSTQLFRGSNYGVARVSSSAHRSSQEGDNDVEKAAGTATTVTAQGNSVFRDTGAVGVSFVIRKGTGLTRLLQSHDSLLTLVDGPYPNNQITEVLKCDRVLLIGGGIGITGLLAWIAAHPNVKLAWSVKQGTRNVVEHLKPALEGVEKEIFIGERLDITKLLEQEARSGWSRIGVVVCGPGTMCDAARENLCRIGKRESGKVSFEFEVDAYSW